MDTTDDVEYQYLRVQGVHIRAGVRRRDSDALPMLLFNGIGASMELLQPFVDEMKNTTVIWYDAPGAGESQPPPYPWRPKHHAQLAASLLDRLGFDRVNVLGISWGGMLAQQFARQFSTRTGRLVLAATSPGHLMVPARLSVLVRMSNPLRYFAPEYMQSIAPKIYGGSLRTNKLRAKEHASKMKPPSIKGYYYQILSLVGWSSLPWLHKLPQPTLILAGDDDPIIPLVNAKIMAARIPGSQLRVVDCGHLFLLTRARVLAPEIEDFLRDA
ncbi:MAG: poly(3-hydroxyalkanoate) depolymerase [Halioglobus sp.]